MHDVIQQTNGILNALKCHLTPQKAGLEGPQDPFESCKRSPKKRWMCRVGDSPACGHTSCHRCGGTNSMLPLLLLLRPDQLLLWPDQLLLLSAIA
jgi:hypothetical protein